MTPAILDTGVIVALLDRSEHHHARCVEAVTDVRGPLVTCEAVVAEACYLLRSITGAPEAVVRNVANGVFQIPATLVDQAVAVEKLLKKYADLPMNLADACLVDLADRLSAGRILTLDRDFEVYRWRTRRKFQFLIEL